MTLELSAKAHRRAMKRAEICSKCPYKRKVTVHQHLGFYRVRCKICGCYSYRLEIKAHHCPYKPPKW